MDEQYNRRIKEETAYRKYIKGMHEHLAKLKGVVQQYLDLPASSWPSFKDERKAVDDKAREALCKFMSGVPVNGVCCGCGYDGEDETPCVGRSDGTHCVHWWDGPDDESRDPVS